MLDTRRHDQLFDPHAFATPVHIVGVGGVGSHVARLLAKLGVGRNSPVVVYDGDRVESYNIANQAYELEHVGVRKVEALREQYRRWSGGIEVDIVPEFVQEQRAFGGIVFLCLDKMNVRKDICERSLWRNPTVKFVVETRTSVRDAMFFAFDPNDKRHVECWNAYWYPNEAADNDLGCNGPMSIVTSVDATAIFAVQSFLDFVRAGDSRDLVNRFCFDLQSRKVLFAETWR